MSVTYGTSGSVTIYINGAQVFTFSGDTTTDGATTLSSVELAGIATGSTNTTWSEIIVLDSDTRGCGLWLMNSNTSGTNSQWAGTASTVNKNQINDTGFVTAASNNLIEDYKPSGGGGSGGIALPAGSYTVLGVVESVRALVGTAGPQHLQAGFNFAGTWQWGSSFAPSTSFGNFSNIVWNTNPNTGAAWTIADITAATFNYSFQSVA
jgi:hypothetical protein